MAAIAAAEEAAELNEMNNDSDMDSDGMGSRSYKPKKPTASLLKQAENGVLKQLTKAIDGHRVTARYCCGGRVSIVTSAAAKAKNNIASPQIVLR